MKREVAKIFECMGNRCQRCEEEKDIEGPLCRDCAEEMSADDIEVHHLK